MASGAPPSAPAASQPSGYSWRSSDPFDDILRRAQDAVNAAERRSKRPTSYVARVATGGEKCARCLKEILRHQFYWDVAGETRCSGCIFR